MSAFHPLRTLRSPAKRHLMPSRLILSFSAVVLAVLGSATLFAPLELARVADPSASPFTAAVIQAAGSGLVAFAILNWMSRRNRIGGIYARPLAAGNLLLFASSSLSIGKAAAAGLLPPGGLALCALLGALAASFAWLVFVHDPLT